VTENRSFLSGLRGCLAEIGIPLLAVAIILIISAGYRNYDDVFACDGGLGVGFPVSFLCDYGAGGSPISSWGKIDLSDFPYFSPRGLFVDIFFYAGVLCLGRLLRFLLHPSETYAISNGIWILLIGIALAIGYLSAAAIYKSDRINFHNYLLGIPTPLPASPTPFGIPPPPPFTPIPTVGP
jgi:hypothetical protein